ncbi:hypothetical protein MPHL21000_09670 [Mycolicibacterium phlei DSM 43239 = CCUG 21000]|uniref:Uncharacterized protein n=1 Tax=Mycolicibacterium phlei DSM 43239 = CCUG 21000 TaxID=1226750 RepID=A0A5N5V4Q3_MYCPH|nr:hypothetical protein MPHL21000_09670 [Mycolicibacterium phlei DSM 43239 = CCUG 21000]
MPQRQPRQLGGLRLRGAGTSHHALRAVLGEPDHRRPAHPQHPRRLIGEHLQLGVARRGRDVVDQLQLAVRLQQPGVRPHRVDVDALELFGGGDQHVGHGARRQFDHQVVDGVAGGSLHHVEGQDVGADRPERHGQGAEAAWSILQLDAQQVRRHAQHSRTAPTAQHSRRRSRASR